MELKEVQMAVLRINKKETYFLILDKTCLKKGLSWGAKGLHAYLISLPQENKILKSPKPEDPKIEITQTPEQEEAIRSYRLSLQMIIMDKMNLRTSVHDQAQCRELTLILNETLSAN